MIPAKIRYSKMQPPKLKTNNIIYERKSPFLKLKYKTLEKEIHNFNTKPKFDIEDHKDIDENITFYTGFQNYETLELPYASIWLGNNVIVGERNYVSLQATINLAARES